MRIIQTSPAPVLNPDAQTEFPPLLIDVFDNGQYVHTMEFDDPRQWFPAMFAKQYAGVKTGRRAVSRIETHDAKEEAAA